MASSPFSTACSATWPVSSRNTSSRVGSRNTSVVGSSLRGVERPDRVEHRRPAVAVSHADVQDLPVDSHGADVRQLLGRDRRVVGVAEPDLDHGRAELVLQVRRGALGDHEPVVDDDDVVGEVVGLLEVLRGEQHGDPGGGEVLDHAPQLDPTLRVEAGGGLVEEQHRRSVHERGGEVEAPAHPARVRAHDPVGGVDEREVVEQLVAARRDARPTPCA